MEESLVQVDRNTSAHLTVQWYKCIKKEDKIVNNLVPEKTNSNYIKKGSNLGVMDSMLSRNVLFKLL